MSASLSSTLPFVLLASACSGSLAGAQLGFDPADYSSALTLTVTAGGDPIPLAFPVMLPLDSTRPIDRGELSEDGRDLRLVFHVAGEEAIELDRFLRHMNTDSTEIWFPTQAPISPLACDARYLLYYGNPDESSEAPSDPNDVFVPHMDDHTVALFHYENGEGLIVTDHSGKGHHAAAGPEHSPPSWSHGRFGGGMDFGHRSINNYADIPDAPDLRLAEGTYETWVLTNTLGPTQGFMSKDHVGFTTGGHMTMSWDSGLDKLRVRLQSGSQHYYVYNTCEAIPDKWYHVAFTFGPAGMHLYIDNELQDWNAYTGGMETNDNTLALGAATSHSPSPPHDLFMDGLLDGTRISNVQRDFFPYAGVRDDPLVTAEPADLPKVLLECCGLVACEGGTFVYRVHADNPTDRELELKVRIITGPGIPGPIDLFSSPIESVLDIEREYRFTNDLPNECPVVVKIGAGLIDEYGDIVASDIGRIELIPAETQ